jgi:hypothetical protein
MKSEGKYGDRIRVNKTGEEGLEMARQDFFKARRKNVVIHTSTMIIGWRSEAWCQKR